MGFLFEMAYCTGKATGVWLEPAVGRRGRDGRGGHGVGLIGQGRGQRA